MDIYRQEKNVIFKNHYMSKGDNSIGGGSGGGSGSAGNDYW